MGNKAEVEHRDNERLIKDNFEKNKELTKKCIQMENELIDVNIFKEKSEIKQLLNKIREGYEFKITIPDNYIGIKIKKELIFIDKNFIIQEKIGKIDDSIIILKIKYEQDMFKHKYKTKWGGICEPISEDQIINYLVLLPKYTEYIQWKKTWTLIKNSSTDPWGEW